ncbi:TonB-dependent receptor [Flavobacterium sp. CBA20B-1]|uniref:TonB-dependent receptor domain-containing protein n=1 Tax=unclassified Flavobacterium TaxID=196869 RepID=UPI0022252C59|nr:MULTISPECIES: TonB-dependent receptor [unclassified Flavobacterium]WCM41536.1 TonB-dependent receptor [Flavobacterium sp. CBA20B-1]
MKNILLACTLLFAGLLHAQNIKIEGLVTFEGEPIPETFITVKTEKVYHATTNDSGYFMVEIPENVTQYTIIWEHSQFKAVTKSFQYSADAPLNLEFTEQQEEVLSGIVIDQTNKNIRRFADKTVVDVENLTVLNAGSVFDAVNKLPGVLVTANGQIAHNGKLATIFLDGEPTGMSGDQLTNFLKNLPANTVKSIEIIDRPGAKYSATFNGTIINVITKSAKIEGISGSITQENIVNSRIKNNTSAQIMFKKNKLSWNMNTGYTHHEGNTNSLNEFSYNSNGLAVKARENYWNNGWYQNYYLRNNWQYKITDLANLTLKYNYNHTYSKPKSYGTMFNAFGDTELAYKQQTANRSNNNIHELQFIYAQKLDTIGTNFTLTSNTEFQNNTNSNQLFVEGENVSTILADNNFVYSQTRADFETPFKAANGTLSLGAHYTHSVSGNNGSYIWEQARTYIPYDFKYTNKAAYASVSGKISSLMISAGVRLENLTYQSETAVDSLDLKQDFTNLFPTVSLKYNLMSGVYLSAGYSKRMNLPGAQSFNPNVTSQNSLLVANAGNPNLKPQISHNMNATLTVFDYIYFNYNLSKMPNQNVVFYEIADNGTLESKSNNIENGFSQSFNMGLPIPYAMFTKGIKNMINDRNGLNVDELSFTYLNAGYFKTTYDEVIPDRFQRGAFYIFTYSQFYLGNNTRVFVTYYNMFKGVMNLYELNKPAQNLNISVNKKFMDNKLTLNVGIDNVLNTDGFDVNVFGNGLQMRTQTLNERRMFKVGLTFNFGSFKDQNQQLFPQGTPPFKTN